MLDRAGPPNTAMRHRDVAELRRPEACSSWSRDVYPDDVTRRDIDSDAFSGWARYLKGIQARPGWSVARLAREADIHRTTIFRWIAGDTENISTQRVIAIAEAVGDDPAVALRAVGDMLTGETADPDAPDMSDPVVRKIMSFNVDDEMRQMMLERHRENLEFQRRRWIEDIERDVRRRGVA